MTIDTKTLRICALTHADANRQATAQLLIDAADHIDGLTKHNEYLLARLRKQEQQLEAIGAGGVSAQRISGR